jgi:hypothetical protein
MFIAGISIDFQMPCSPSRHLPLPTRRLHCHTDALCAILLAGYLFDYLSFFDESLACLAPALPPAKQRLKRAAAHTSYCRRHY